MRKNGLTRLLSVILALAFMLTTMPLPTIIVNAVTNEFAGGSGTENDPYLIATKYHLDNVRNYLDAHYKLIADIEFTDSDFLEGGDFYNGGDGWESIVKKSSSYYYGFTGTFDGNNFKIVNLTIRASSNNNPYIGLFGYISDGTVKNLGLKDSNISIEIISQAVYSGSVAGCINGGKIVNCYNSGNITAAAKEKNDISTSSYVGGIVGYSTSNGIINNCYNSGCISAITESSYSNSYAGGITAYSDFAISNSYNSGKVISDIVGGTTYDVDGAYSYSGGIVGYGTSNATIDNCYNIGYITADAYSYSLLDDVLGRWYTQARAYSYSGGISGEFNGTINNCYNTGQVVASSKSFAHARTTVRDFDIRAYSLSEARAGGISGEVNTKTVIQNCYNIGKINSTPSASALAVAPSSYNTTTEYNTVKVTGEITGNKWYSNDGTSKVENSYYLKEINDNTNNPYSTVKACDFELMKMALTFEGFDFETIWTMDGNLEYPFPELQTVNMSFKKELECIEIKSIPTKLQYLVQKETLDVSGGKFLLKYKNFPNEEINFTEDMISGFDNTILGKQTLTVTFNDKTYTYEVEIIKDSVEKPAEPTVAVKTDTTITLTAVSGYEYKLGDGAWQTSNVFTGLNPNTEYIFYQRIAETSTTYASEASIGTKVTTSKSEVKSPNAPTLKNSTFNSVTLTEVSGYEYKLGDGAWQKSNIFSGLLPNVSYTFYQRVAETSTTYASPTSVGLTVTTDKVTVNAPIAPILESKTDTTVTLVAIKGYEYKVNNGNWQKDNVFINLSANTSYTFYQRIYETDTAYASDVSKGIIITTDGPDIIEGWKLDGIGWWYQYANGGYAIGWAQIGGSWYYFNASGYMVTGWLNDGGVWYYMSGSGAMHTGWLNDGGVWYYMNASGAMVSGWLNLGGTWYYMNSSGAMHTGWLNLGGTWYYMNSSGAMVTGWQQIGVTWYYFYGGGNMATGWILDGGVWYLLDSSGAWIG